MTDPDPITEGVELSRGRARRWAPIWQVLYAALITLGWLAIVVAAVIVGGLFVGGATFESVSLAIMLVVVMAIGVIVMSWLLWNFAISSVADLVTRGAFSRYRTTKLARFDTYFSRVALGALLAIVLVPFFAIFQ